MTAIDPYRTLGLVPGASQAEIKRAYRQLAKLYHPDSAGERAVPRFLAIQAAYEALLDDPGQSRRGRAAPGRSAGPATPPWQADAARARATRDAYRARTRRGPAGGPTGPTWARPDASAGEETTAGAAGDPAASAGGPAGGSTRARGSGAPGGGSTGNRSAGGGSSSRSGRRRKATIGSTSYDGVEAEPFTPPWEGATWYGAGSGTYWTLNPKEYADPRKHGPEYLARSRRASGPGPGGASGEAGASAATDATAEAPADGRFGDPTDPRPPTPQPGPPPNHASTSPGRSPSPGASARAMDDPPPAGGAGARRANAAADAQHPAPSATGSSSWARGASGPRVAAAAAPPPSLSGPARFSATPAGRIGLALLGWLPIGLALAALTDAVPACTGVATVCTDPLRGGVWPIHLALIALLVAIPRLGAIAAVGGVAFLVVGLAATPVLLALGGSQTRESTAALLGIVLAIAWVAGIALALSGRVELPPWRGRRVR